MSISLNQGSSVNALTVRQKMLAMLGICGVLVMVSLDQTVVGTAMPTIMVDLQGFKLYTWVGTAYLLTSVISVPVFGKLGDDYGRKPFVLASIVVFTLASALCGLAQSMLQLILARALQGIGGGMLVATTFACVPDLFPDARQMIRWQVVLSAGFGLANAIGPFLGGIITQYIGWRWVFLVNLPFGVISLFMVSRFLPTIRQLKEKAGRLDWVGAVLVAGFLACLQFGVESLNSDSLLYQISLGLGALVFLVLFVVHEQRCANPLVPMGMFRNRSLSPLFALSFVTGFAMFGVMYYAPLMFQGGFHLSPNGAGLLVMPLVVSITFGSFINGRILLRIRSASGIFIIGILMFMFGAFSLSQVMPLTQHWLIVLVMICGGLGLGLLLPNMTLFVQQSSERHYLGVSTAMLQSMRMIGGMIGTALIGVIVTTRYTDRVTTLTDKANWLHSLKDPQLLLNQEAASHFLRSVGSSGTLLLESARFSLIEAIHMGLWFAVGIMAVGLIMVWIMPSLRLVSQPGAPVINE